MSIDVTTKAFHELIKSTNRAHFYYNRGDKLAATFILDNAANECLTLAHHIRSELAADEQQNIVNTPKNAG